MPLVLVTGAAGIAGRETVRQLLAAGYAVRMADAVAPTERFDGVAFVRCDTRTADDVDRAVAGCDAVVHLAAWHCAHQPPVSDATLFAVNVDGTFQVFEACRKHGVTTIVYASSMAYGYGGVYSVTKVIGEDLCRTYHEITGASVAMLRYHDFVPKPYVAFGEKLLYNGVDAADVAASNVAAVRAGLARAYGLFRTIVHTDHGLPERVQADFRAHGPDWCEGRLPGSAALIAKVRLNLPERVEQHDLSEAARVLDWRPRVGFLDFLNDLAARDAAGEDIAALWSPGSLQGVRLSRP
jgi:nucleoside-diphosphate-sugar epimerase